MAEFSISNPVPIPMSKARIRGSNYSLRYSPKLGDYVEMASELEDRHYVCKEADPEVVGICPQALHVNERINGKKLNTIFDLWTRSSEGHETLWEVSAQSSLQLMDDGAAVPPKWPLIEAWANHHGADVRFVTEIDIDAKACLIDNWTRALPYIGKSANPHTEHIEDWLRERLKGEAQSTLAALVAECQHYSADDVITGVVRLLHRGHLLSDIDHRHFGPNTLIGGI